MLGLHPCAEERKRETERGRDEDMHLGFRWSTSGANDAGAEGHVVVVPPHRERERERKGSKRTREWGRE